MVELALPISTQCESLLQLLPRASSSIKGCANVPSSGSTNRNCKRHQAFDGSLAIRIDITPPDDRRRDCDNVQKAVLDALQHAGAFWDDSQVVWLLSIKHDSQPTGTVKVQLEDASSLSLSPCNGDRLAMSQLTHALVDPSFDICRVSISSCASMNQVFLFGGIAAANGKASHGLRSHRCPMIQSRGQGV